MITRSAVLVLFTLGLGACSSGGSDSPASPPGGSPSAGDPATSAPGADASTEAGTGDAGSAGPGSPSNEELQASEGVVTVEQADALIVGRWANTNPGTQCVSTLSFASDGTFTESQLDKVAGGFYDLGDFEGGIELIYDYTSDNGQVDCFGDNEPLVEEGVTFSDFVSFPDRDTMRLSDRPNGAGFSRDYVRR